jgi:hypothetical protein
VGQSIHVDGVDDVLDLTAAGIDTTPGHAVTFAFWMRWSGTYYAIASGWSVIINMPGPPIMSPAGYHLTFVDMGTPQMAFGFNTGNNDLWGVDATTLASRWVHVAAVFRNGSADTSTLYLDGVLQAPTQTTGVATVETVTPAMELAAFPQYPSYWAGELDEFAVWNAELSPAEIAALVAAPSRCP